MKGRLKERLKDLTSLCGVSGDEREVVRYLRDVFMPIADSVDVDSWGNIYAMKRGCTDGPTLMVSAHSDEIGMVVKSIRDDGFICFDRVGGVNDVLLSGRKVLIKGKIPGVIGIKAGHLQKEEEKRRVRSIRECYIDVGVSSKEEAEAMGIRIGHRITFQSDFTEMYNPDLISTKSIDNRVSCAIILELFNNLKNQEFPGIIYGVVCVQEEIGLRGAAMAVRKVKPDWAIVLDTIPCGDTPDINFQSELPIKLGHGPVCPLIDGIAGGFANNVVHPKIAECIERHSQKTGVNVQYVTLSGESYTTDATNVSLAGIPTGLLTTPRRYSHSPVELVNMNDAAGLLNILNSMVMSNGEIDFTYF